MNENIDLTKILKNCPAGTKLYSTILGEVTFIKCNTSHQIEVNKVNKHYYFTSQGKFIVLGMNIDCGECTLFPSKGQRDWSTFSAPWYKRDRFDPKTLLPFDKVLLRDTCSVKWKCGIFSHINDDNDEFRYYTVGTCYVLCIPYNEETKHLVGTTDEAPEYYRYWED